MDFKPEDIKIQTGNKLVDEFWTGVIRYVMNHDPNFFKQEEEQYKKELNTFGKEQADKNQEERMKRHVEKMSKVTT